MVALGTVVQHITAMTSSAQSLSEPRSGRRATRVKRAGREDVARLAQSLRSAGKAKNHDPAVIDLSGVRHVLSADLAAVLERAAGLLAEGKRVSVFAEDEMLTTQQAADRLNVSRQYLTRLLERGDLPSIRVGSHRRVVANEVAAYKRQRDAKRDQDLDELVAISEDLGGYALSQDAD